VKDFVKKTPNNGCDKGINTGFGKPVFVPIPHFTTSLDAITPELLSSKLANPALAI